MVGSIAASSSSPTVPPVVLREANSSFGVVRKSYHHHGRGIALMIVPRVSCGGMLKPLRLSRRRAPATGVSTVNCSVSNPAAAARRASSYEISRSRMTYSWNQFRPGTGPRGSLRVASRTPSMEVVPSVESVNGMPAAAAAPAPATSPSVCMSLVNPVGAMPNGSAEGPPRISMLVSTSGAGLRMPGWNSTSWNAWRARLSDSSPSAAPSV